MLCFCNCELLRTVLVSEIQEFNITHYLIVPPDLTLTSSTVLPKCTLVPTILPCYVIEKYKLGTNRKLKSGQYLWNNERLGKQKLMV